MYEPEVATEFPVVNTNFTGYKSKYVYLAYLDEVVPESQLAKDNMTIRGFFKFDTDAKKVIAKVDLGEDNRGGEIFF